MKVVTLAASLALATVSASNVTFMAHNESIGLLAATCIQPEYHFDFPGYDLQNVPAASFDKCCPACYGRIDCAAYTWTTYNGGTCWLKSYRSGSEWKGANADGSANTISAELNRCGISPKGNQDLIGTNGAIIAGKYPETCCQHCITNGACTGFAWNNYNGGTCYIKIGAIQAVYKPGVYSLIVNL